MKKPLNLFLLLLAIVGLNGQAQTGVSLPTEIAGPIINPVNGHSYYLLSRSTWTDAEAKALELGGHLVTINDADENAWVLNTFASRAGVEHNLWIGFNDARQDGTFRWTSGELVTYTNWRPGEPNASLGEGEDYTYIYGQVPGFPDVYGQWNDISDFSTPGGTEPHLYGVVEINPPEPALPEVIAGPIINPVNGHSYYLLSRSIWTDAEAKALELGGHLVTINDADENAWVLNTFASFAGVEHNLWIGFNDARQDGTFRWTSGELVTYTNWRPGEPNASLGEGEDYTYIYGHVPGFPDVYGQWNDISDFSTPGGTEPHLHGVVEINPPEPALPEVIAGPINNPVNGHSYYLLSRSTWTDAEAKALELGGHLVTINDADENAWVLNTFASRAGVEHNLWIGFNDARQDGTFRWTSGEPVTYTNWRPGEPNASLGEGEDYTYIYGQVPGFPDVYGQWNDISDFSTPGGTEPPLHGVVEINPPALPEVIAGPIINPVNGHSYYLLSRSTWTDAEAKALELGGHLVTINNADENAWVLNTFASLAGVEHNLWIGFNDARQEGTFRWTSGEPVTYTNWRPGEPNASLGEGEDYTYIYGHVPGFPHVYGQWNDISDFSTPGGTEPPLHGVVELTAQAQAILDALAARAAPRITSISRARGGHSHLTIRGVAGRTYLVESSTDLIHWVRVGTTTPAGGDNFQFDDGQNLTLSRCFYRLVSP